ncbi:hypothetical protein niasHT_015802 [Heterodera trifolii]|uniref:Uncharacterized protein n=1 Tax=Heterodera trifolii TaxID=157864 RepID=A0ABD2L6X3_9BILA
MSLNPLSIELEVSEDKLTTNNEQLLYSFSPCEIVISHAQFSDGNFSLFLLLTSNANLLVQYKFCASQFASVSLKKFFPEKDFSQLATVAITADCSLIVCISNDGPTIFLVPFCAFINVSWSRRPTLLVPHPTSFSLLGFESAVSDHSPLSAAICFQSSDGHTFLMFGDLSGSLFIANLNLRRIDAKIDLGIGICSLHSFTETDGERLLLVSLSDRTQVILPLQGRDFSVRETLIRITPSQIHRIDKHLYIFPQLNESVCVLDSSKKQLALFDSLLSVWSASPRFCLDCFESGFVRQVICTSQMVAVLTPHNLSVQFRSFQSNGNSLRYAPMEVILPPQFSCKTLHLIASANSTQNGQSPLQCFSAISEKGLFALRTQKPFNEFIFALLDSQFYSSNCLSSFAVSLQISPAELCLSLLRHSLRNPSNFQSVQIDGIISLAFKCKIDPNEILSVLRENSRGHFLLPFLRIKIERDSGDDSFRQLFLGVIFGRITQITDEEAKNGEESEHGKELEAEKNALESELRHFLNKFDTDASDLLLLSLRHSLFSCVCVLLCRNAPLHSPTVARSLLELSDWNNRRVGSLLKCLSLVHWPSVDSFSPAIVAKLFTLVPSVNVVQLKMVNRIAKLLAERSIESAHSLQLFCSLRLSHLTERRNEHSNLAQKMERNSVDCASNCTVLLAEDVCGTVNTFTPSDRGEFQPFFWGEFSAGIQRLLRNERAKSDGEKCAALAIGSAIPTAEKKGENGIADDASDAVSATKKRLPGRKERPNAFSLCPFPGAVKVANSDLTFCAVACGTEHVLLLTDDGRLFSWGINRFGQCGNGTEEPIHAPIEIIGKWGRIVSICAGHYHSGFISEKDEIYLWGWGLHGQLGNGRTANLKRPAKSRPFTDLDCVKKLCLGYSHSLALLADGRVFGCGAFSHGQLGIDPHNLEGCPTKALAPVQLQFPMPISLIASKYFHGIALGVDHLRRKVLFEWGDSPQSLKMNAFLQKRLKLKQKKAKDKSFKMNGQENPPTAERKGEAQVAIIEMDELERVHFNIRTVCEWNGAEVKALSAGFNHSALLTLDGQLFTWGKSLEMQLGHQNRKEKGKPTKVDVTETVRWSEVVCARNFTTAISVEGKVFVWGRNDKFQLGLGKTTKKETACQIRTIALKSDKGNAQRSVELPVDNCVERPTIVHGLRAFVKSEAQTIPDEKQLNEMISNADQLSLDSLSRFLLKHSVPHWSAVQVHLMSGDLLAALRLLAVLAHSEDVPSELVSPLSPSNWSERPVAFIARANVPKMSSPSAVPFPSKGSSESKRMVAVHLKSTFCSSPSLPSAADNEHLPIRRLDSFHAFVDKIWAILRVHPSREVQTCALIELLLHRFPIYNRLAMDLCLCRLVDPFLTISSPSQSVPFSSIRPLLPSRIRLTEIGARERAALLRLAEVTDRSKNQICALKDRCDRLLAQKKWRFFSACGHFEKCVGGGTEFEAKRTKRRQCAKCEGGRDEQ